MKKNQKCIDMLNEALKAANENEDFLVVCLLSRTSPTDFKLGRIAAYDVDDIIEILETGKEPEEFDFPGIEQFIIKFACEIIEEMGLSEQAKKELKQEIKDLAKNGEISESRVKDILNREKEKENKPREKFEKPAYFCRKYTLDNSNTECLTQCEICKNYDQAQNQHGESQETNSEAGSTGGSEAGNTGGTDTGANAGTDTGTDTGANAGTDTGANAGTDTGADTGANAGTYTGTDTDTGAGTVNP